MLCLLLSPLILSLDKADSFLLYYSLDSYLVFAMSEGSSLGANPLYRFDVFSTYKTGILVAEPGSCSDFGL